MVRLPCAGYDNFQAAYVITSEVPATVLQVRCRSPRRPRDPCYRIPQPLRRQACWGCGYEWHQPAALFLEGESSDTKSRDRSRPSRTAAMPDPRRAWTTLCTRRSAALDHAFAAAVDLGRRRA